MFCCNTTLPIEETELVVARSTAELPEGTDPEALSEFLVENMKPYHDSISDTRSGVLRALSGGGFVVCATLGGSVAGALVMLDTGMQGYVPPNLLLFVAVKPSLRRRGIGRRIIEKALNMAEGGIKLHVEPDNPARRLYERIGFAASYIDMRMVR